MDEFKIKATFPGLPVNDELLEKLKTELAKALEPVVREYIHSVQSIDHDKEMGRPGLNELGHRAPYYRYYRTEPSPDAKPMKDFMSEEQWVRWQARMEELREDQSDDYQRNS